MFISDDSCMFSFSINAHVTFVGNCKIISIDISFTLDQTMLLKIPVWIRHYHLLNYVYVPSIIIVISVKIINMILPPKGLCDKKKKAIWFLYTKPNIFGSCTPNQIYLVLVYTKPNIVKPLKAARWYYLPVCVCIVFHK